MSQQKTYDSTVARIAGNLLSGVITADQETWSISSLAIRYAVEAAREIVAETKRTEPKEPETR